jgi:hypothetical protein
MLEDIGKTAGRLWKTLGIEDKVSLSQLPKELNEKDEVVFQALGWLARENKIAYSTKGGKIFVGLSDKERQVYKGLPASARTIH